MGHAEFIRLTVDKSSFTDLKMINCNKIQRRTTIMLRMIYVLRKTLLVQRKLEGTKINISSPK